MIRVVLAIVLILALASCKPDSGVRYNPLWKDSPKVELSSEEQCLVDLHRERGLEGDKCIADCLEHGGGENVGGGCWHVCFAYTGLEWVEMPKMDSCYADTTR